MRVKIILLIVGLAVGIFFYWRSTPLAPVTEVVATTLAPAPKTEISTPKARERALYAGPRPVVEPALVKKQELKPECVAFWDKLRGLDLEKSFNGPVDAENPFPVTGGCQSVPKALETAHQHFQQFCGVMAQLKALPREQADVGLAQCQTMSLLYRAQIADWLSRDIPLKEIKDNRILADKLLAKFADNPAGAAEVAEQMLARDPELGFAAKAAAIGRFMDAQTTATGNSKDPKWEKANESQARLDSIKDGDKPQADEIRLLIAQRRDADPRGFRDEAVSLAEKDPSSWVGPYYAAWGEHALKNKQKAGEWLDQCLTDARCREAKENLAKGGEAPFQSHLTFGLNPLEKNP